MKNRDSKKNWRLVVPLMLFSCVLWSQNGPYPIFEFPPSENWAAFDSIQSRQNISAALVWQPSMTTPTQGILLSKHGLAILPASILDSSMLKKSTWLSNDPTGQELPLYGVRQLACLIGMEDVTKDILTGIPDTISSGARSIKITNALLKYNGEESSPAAIKYIRSFYGGNRFYRFEWQYLQARLLGQVFAPNGESFVLVRLSPFSAKTDLSFSYYPLHSGEKLSGQNLFVEGMQTFPKNISPPSEISLYYTQLLPLLNETQLILTTNWEEQRSQPDWLEKLESTNELEMPLHVFAEPAQSIKETQMQEHLLFQSLKEDRNRWWKYQQIQQNIQSGYDELTPLLIAEKLGQEIIPTRLQLFRLIRLLMQWEKSMAANAAMLEKRAGSLEQFLAYFYQSFHPEVDQRVAGQLFELYLGRIRYDLQSPFTIEQWIQAEKNPQIMAAALYQKSGLTNGVEVQKAFKKDPAAFFQQLHHDYAYRFVEKWENEHQDHISKVLQKKKEYLREEQRKMIKGLLEFAPQKASVEKGGLSFTLIPFTSDQELAQISPHLLGNYPPGSPVLSLQGRLMGITFLEGDHPLLFSQSSNRVLSIDFLRELKKKYPNHQVTQELFELE